ncbi:MAG TPA: FAD-dependent oxidoreductase [Gaiellaceae bacterium]|jgi:sulfide:quinone oxidoreductase
MSMGKAARPIGYGGLRVLIAGGGVAGLEAMLALRALAGELVDIELLSVEHDFWYRPLAVAEPFDAGRAHRFDLGRIAEAAGACLTPGELSGVDTDAHVARTAHGPELEYDVLLLACGALPRPMLPGALTFRGPADTERFTRLLRELEAGSVKTVVFALPSGASWSLPLYELALLTSAHVQERGIAPVELSLVTHEPAPLALFGQAASDGVAALLAERGIGLHTGCYPAAFEHGMLELVPKATIAADRVVALPRLEGARIAGIPQDGDGFVATDEHGRVKGLANVYAAGDITAFPVKQGGIAAQQADAVAEAIAAQAGADVKPRPFDPVLRGLLLTGGTPVYLRAELPGGRGDTSTIADEALWWPPGKIVGRYLAPFLAEYGNLEIEPVAPDPPSSRARPS